LRYLVVMAHGRNTAPVSGTKIRHRREEAGLTLRALADLCAEHGQGATYSQLSLIERDRVRPRPPLLKALAGALGTTVAELLDRGPHDVEVAS
jgi:transcriptional regulator with XRE-family HTH domain